MRLGDRNVSLLAILAVAGAVTAFGQDLREEFHQTYAVSPNARVSLSNVNGAVRLTAWDRNEVKVDAIKKARTQEALREAEIVVEARADLVDIRTKYPERNHNRDAASVEYTLTVPRQSALDKISTVNGSVTVEGVAGPVRISTVNGNVTAKGLEGDLELSTVNGRAEADFSRVPAKQISLKTVNGGIGLGLPQGANARLTAKTVHGGVESDFDLPVRKVGFGPGSELETVLGSGGADIRLDTVNGGISLRRR